MSRDTRPLPLQAESRAALAFATALTEGEFSKAHGMLARDSAQEFSVIELQARYEEMVSYWPSPATRCEVMEIADDPELLKRSDEVAWAYVSIVGSECAEAVTVCITDDLRVRVEKHGWGRP
jgi:hypothetical protein